MNELLDDVYLDRPEQWARLALVLRMEEVIGLDTEFYGLDVRKESCVGKARVHVWSVAVRTAKRSPRGFARARGWVLPAAALLFPELRAVLEGDDTIKCVHNQAVDDHAIHNHGVDLRGCVNTLGLARWKWPGLVTAGGFGLKNLMAVKLNRAPIAEFKQVVGFERPILVSSWKKQSRTECSCGSPGCRKRKPDEQHDEDGEFYVTRHDKKKVVDIIEVVKEKIEKGAYPLESIVPGHERWDLLVRYAAEDAVAALEVEELARLEKDPAPWPYDCHEGRKPSKSKPAEGRPDFSQEVENHIVAMEREGFPVDVPWCTTQAKQAMEDEEKELAWLHRWHVVNGAQTEGPHRREETDPIWRSPKQLAAYFDALSFPRSPVWKKGRVKRDDVKMDAVALEWIGRNCAGARKLVTHLLHLKRIRSGLKYLLQLLTSDGHVYPICGPAGDADDRNGAVTGRLGIKGTLAAQQLPQVEELDLYKIRRAIVANAVPVDSLNTGTQPETET